MASVLISGFPLNRYKATELTVIINAWLHRYEKENKKPQFCSDQRRKLEEAVLTLKEPELTHALQTIIYRIVEEEKKEAYWLY